MHKLTDYPIAPFFHYSGLNKYALAGVSLVCGGAVVIVCLIWIGICCGLWKIEREMRKFKKVVHSV